MNRLSLAFARTVLDSFWTSFESYRVLRALGYRRAPVDGAPNADVFGVSVYIRPLAPVNPSRHRRNAHRVRALCPLCGRDVSAGRLSQHVVSHSSLDS